MAVTEYVWNAVHDTVLAETDENGDTTAVYTNEPVQYGNLVSQQRSAAVSYFHFDGHGNTQALTDENENVTDTYTYSAFGEEIAKTGTTENPYRYGGEPGYYYDTETEDYYVRRRTYSPLLGRWMSVDPLPSILLLHPYLFTENSPLNYSDPSGLDKGDTEVVRVPKSGGRVGPDIKMILVKMDAETCGKNTWTIKWELAGAGAEKVKDKGGYILQHVTLEALVHNCDGGDITLEIAAGQSWIDKNYKPAKKIEFWEAWPIKPGKRTSEVNGSMDIFGDGFFGETCGKIVGVADYYLVVGDVPADFFDKDNEVPIANNVPATFNDMSGLVGKKKGQPHDLTAKWDCCECKCGELEVPNPRDAKKD